MNGLDLPEKEQSPAIEPCLLPASPASQVSDMRFKWKKLRQMANERNDQISQLQGGFKRDLIAQVGRFAQEVVQFRKQFETHGPMVAGISPQEAMERLKKYQRLYDDKERCGAGTASPHIGRLTNVCDKLSQSD